MKKKKINVTYDRVAAEEFYKEYSTRIKTKEDDTKSIISNTDYIDWIINFTSSRDSFNNGLFRMEYCVQNNYNDLDNINKLDLFYNAISKYAKDNCIYPSITSLGNFYRIKYNGIGYEIGVMITGGDCYYCNKVDIYDEKEFIDFNDIMNNKKLYTAIAIKAKIDYINTIIVGAYESGVPIELITSSVEETLSTLNERHITEEQYKRERQ